MDVPRHYECKYVLSHGREYCQRECPICQRAKGLFKVKSILTSESYSGSAPTVFVGQYGYPNVNMGIMAPPEIREDAWDLDAPKHWSTENYQIPKLIDIRSSLVNSRFQTQIKGGSGRHLEMSQEIAMASSPTDIEVDLTKKPHFSINFSPDIAPTGPSAALKKLSITSNPKISRAVDKVVSDSDLLATGAMQDLHTKGFDETHLSRLLSAGLLGTKTQRKLVPTRWSITATDDMIGKQMITEVKDYKFSEYNAWFGSYLGNYFLVLGFPDIWRYELFELFINPRERRPSASVPYTTDFENFGGRKEYAYGTAGGYYASRLSALEGLKNSKRQSSVLVIRFITDEYTAPLGVWVVREATRRAMASPPLTFASEELLMTYARSLAKKKFGYDLQYIEKKSKLIREVKMQRKLTCFF